jgi:hypothetical protein
LIKPAYKLATQNSAVAEDAKTGMGPSLDVMEEQEQGL